MVFTYSTTDDQTLQTTLRDFLFIPPKVTIGLGLYMLATARILIINPTAVIGNNVNIGQFTTIGSKRATSRTDRRRSLHRTSVCIVDNVEIAAGACIEPERWSHATSCHTPSQPRCTRPTDLTGPDTPEFI